MTSRSDMTETEARVDHGLALIVWVVFVVVLVIRFSL